MQTANRTMSLILLSLVATSCGEVTGLSSSSSSNSGLDNPASGFNSDITSNNITEIDLSEGAFTYSLDNTDDAVIMVVSYNEDEDQQGFQILTSESEAEAGDYLMASVNGTEDEMPDTSATEAVHESLRYMEASLSDPASGFTQLRTVEFSESQAEVEDERTFKIIQSFSDTSQYTTINAVLVYEGDHILHYIDERDYNEMSDEDLDTTVEMVEDVDQNMIPIAHELGGEPSDVDGNGRMFTVQTREVNEYSGIYNSLITGYFFAGDTFPTSSSNIAEMAAFIVNDPTGQHGVPVSNNIFFNNIFKGVILHEYQHAINFNQHYRVNNVSTEESWLNEGLSHIFEDIENIPLGSVSTSVNYARSATTSVDDFELAESGIENFSRVSTYLGDIHNVCFTCGSNLKQRGGSYLMLRYAYEQSDDGNALIRNLINGRYRGTENIKDVMFGDHTDNESFSGFLSLWGTAMLLSNTDISHLDLDEQEKYEFKGINLRAIQNDNRGTVLNGPALMTLGNSSFTAVLQGVSIGYIEVSADNIADLDNLYLNFENPNDFRAFLIQ